jgi:hypothetical protein
LFIDEIGKFITRSNDYFFPLAAPLIYAFFLLSVLVYLWIRNQRSDDPSNEFYRILDLLERGASPNLSPQEQDRLVQRLRQITARSAHPRSIRLAENALSILEAETEKPRTRDFGFFEAWLERFREVEARWIGQTRIKVALILGFLFLALRGLLVVVVILVLMIEIVAPSSWQEIIATPWWDKNPIGAPRLILFAFVLFSEAAIGLSMLAVTGLLLTGKIRRGITIGYWVLLFSLTALHLPVFYFEQFEGITTTLLQFSLLLGIIRYRFYFPESMETSV